MSDYGAQFNSVADLLSTATKGLYNKIDHMLFKALVACLKSEDYQAVSVAIDQLVKEQKLIGIPPLYFVAKAHPNDRARKKAEIALTKFNQDKRIAELTDGKEIKIAVTELIKEYGNYKG
ncbi:MAG: hypothetical protein WC028_04370 [Candidatus Obscuribacterales bacterium]|jgi:hypothetical protein